MCYRLRRKPGIAMRKGNPSVSRSPEFSGEAGNRGLHVESGFLRDVRFGCEGHGGKEYNRLRSQSS